MPLESLREGVPWDWKSFDQPGAGTVLQSGRDTNTP